MIAPTPVRYWMMPFSFVGAGYGTQKKDSTILSINGQVISEKGFVISGKQLHRQGSPIYTQSFGSLIHHDQFCIRESNLHMGDFIGDCKNHNTTCTETYLIYNIIFANQKKKNSSLWYDCLGYTNSRVPQLVLQHCNIPTSNKSSKFLFSLCSGQVSQTSFFSL